MSRQRKSTRFTTNSPRCRDKSPWSRIGVALKTTLLFAGLASTAAAQSQQRVEEIVVSGQGGVGSIRLTVDSDAGSRLGLSALEIPASVDLISQDEIATKGDYGALDAVTRSAGVAASASPGNGGTSISSRGFNGHGSTVYTYDGTRLYIVAGTVTFPADTWTLERVEILRGAGSVIQGVGAIGTTINYVPKKPSLAGPDFEALLAGGSFGMRRVALGGNVQLSDSVALRLDGAHQQEDGYVERADERRDVLAGSVLWQASEDLQFRFSVDYADIDAAPYWGTPLIDGAASDDHRRNNYNFADGRVTYEDTWSRLNANWRITDNVTLRGDVYFLDVMREWQNLEEYAYDDATGLIDRAFYLGIVHDEEQAGGRFDFLIDGQFNGLSNQLSIGAEINQIDLNYLNNFTTGGFSVSDSVPVFGFDPGTLPQTSIPTILDYQTETSQFALFVDDRVALSESLSLVLGGRYDHIDFDRLDLAIGGNPASAFNTGFNEFTWRAGLVYQPIDNLSLYAQASTAADPVTSPISISTGNKDFDLSTGRQFEVGLKQQFLSGRAEYTLAWFDIEKQDILTRRPASAITEQIGQQSSSGLEATLRINPSDSVSMDVNVASIDPRFDEFYSGGESLAGNLPRNVPERTANLWLNWALSDSLQL
ncbi:MAG: TonB-dependent siderophore receptor, partial [Pseudohongiellaceae bacterium]